MLISEQEHPLSRVMGQGGIYIQPHFPTTTSESFFLKSDITGLDTLVPLSHAPSPSADH